MKGVLASGDVIDLIAPSSARTPSLLDESIALLASWGLKAHAPHDMLEPESHYANTHKKRLSFLKAALTNPDSKVIWALGGGCGAPSLLPYLRDFTPIFSKTLLGFSDITALHLYAYQTWGWRTLHAPTLRQLVDDSIDPTSVEALKAYLLEGTLPNIPPLSPLNEAARKVTSLKAPLTGGNASLVQYSLGTSWQCRTKDHILFLEDVDEKPYKSLERLEHMKQVGLFDQVRAILFFDFNEKNPSPPDEQPPFEPYFAERIDVPVFKGTGVGHDRVNLPLQIGGTYLLENRGDKTFLSLSN